MLTFHANGTSVLITEFRDKVIVVTILLGDDGDYSQPYCSHTFRVPIPMIPIYLPTENSQFNGFKMNREILPAKPRAIGFHPSLFDCTFSVPILIMTDFSLLHIICKLAMTHSITILFIRPNDNCL